MKKKLIVLTEWLDEKQFYQLKLEVEKNISNVNEFAYLVWVNKHKIIEVLPEINGVNYLTAKDFSLFGRLKNKAVESQLKTNPSTAIIIALEQEKKFIKRVLKNTKLPTIGIHNISSFEFDLSFTETTLKEGDFFRKIDNYLTKIQL